MQFALQQLQQLQQQQQPQQVISNASKQIQVALNIYLKLHCSQPTKQQKKPTNDVQINPQRRCTQTAEGPQEG